MSRNPLGFINDLHSLMTKTKCQFRSYIHRYIFLLSIVVTLEEKKKPAALKLAVNNRRAQLCDFLGGGRDAEQLNFFFTLIANLILILDLNIIFLVQFLH